MKKRDLILICAVVLFVAVLSVGTLLTPDVSFSENENRYLQEAPEFTADTVLSGKFEAKMEDYLSDQIIWREGWVSRKSLAEAALGIRDINGVYLCSDGRAVERITDAEFNSERYEANLNEVAALVEACSQLKSPMPVDVMLVPTAAYVYKDTLPKFAVTFDEDAAFERAARVLGHSLVDIRSSLKGGSEMTFFKTDHHWTGYGAFLGYEAYMERLAEAMNGQTGQDNQTGEATGSTKIGQTDEDNQTGEATGSTKNGQTDEGNQTGEAAGSTKNGQTDEGNQTGEAAGSTKIGQTDQGNQTGEAAVSTKNGQTDEGNKTGEAAGSTRAYESLKPNILTTEFKGTLYSKVLLPFLGIDTIETPSAAMTQKYTVEIDEKKYDSLYFMDYLNKKDKYAVYFGGNYDKVDIRMGGRGNQTDEAAGNTKIGQTDEAAGSTKIGQTDQDNQTCEKLLIVKDSFANSFVPYLIGGLEQITMVDTRYYRGNVAELAKDYDRVLILYGMDSFSKEKISLTKALLQ